MAKKDTDTGTYKGILQGRLRAREVVRFLSDIDIYSTSTIRTALHSARTHAEEMEKALQLADEELSHLAVSADDEEGAMQLRLASGEEVDAEYEE